jgi:uroporphyrinogen decarboxylase
MTTAVRKLRNAYAGVPNVPFYQKEFWLMPNTIERWQSEEGMPTDVALEELFGLDPPAEHRLGQLGGCEAPFSPSFEEKIIEDRGEYEVVQDFAGRHLLCFKNRRVGFMPTYLSHPVKDLKSWEEKAAWRLDPDTIQRYSDYGIRMKQAEQAETQGLIISQNLVGGYMFLRSLIGPEDLLYMFYDNSKLIHICMEAWFTVADAVIASHQEAVTLDEVYFDEDICYNHGPLISPDMIREFLFPYYQQLIQKIKVRQIDRDRHLYFQVDSDGKATDIIDIYQELGMDVMCPFEAASGCDVVKVGKRYPGLVILGGIDKRILVKSKREIDEYLVRVLPAMRGRGGYVPTIDHGVPEEVPYENYLHYRKRCQELGN